MILVISNNETDFETDIICKSLLLKKAPFFRLNLDDFKIKDCYIESQYFIIDTQKYLYKDFSVVYLRRYNYNSHYEGFNNGFTPSSIWQLNLFKQQEWLAFLGYFLSNLSHARIINNLNVNELNKINQIRVASVYGLKTPDIFYTNAKRHVRKDIKLAVKPSTNLGYLNFQGEIYSTYTEIYDDQSIPDVFEVSLLQEFIESDFEIRVLYVDGEFFSCGLFTPVDAKVVDIKKEFVKNVRYSPVKLPTYLEEKITLFMNSLKCKIGCIDVIKTKKNEYVFIEMNPFGKFSYYSDVCNFNFHEKIVNLLIKEYEESKI